VLLAGDTFHFLGGESKELKFFFYNSGLGTDLLTYFLTYFSLDVFNGSSFSLDWFDGDFGDLLF
jgi:hypothetical protein